VPEHALNYATVLDGANAVQRLVVVAPLARLFPAFDSGASLRVDDETDCSIGIGFEHAASECQSDTEPRLALRLDRSLVRCVGHIGVLNERMRRLHPVPFAVEKKQILGEVLIFLFHLGSARHVRLADEDVDMKLVLGPGISRQCLALLRMGQRRQDEGDDQDQHGSYGSLRGAGSSVAYNINISTLQRAGSGEGNATYLANSCSTEQYL
jgi:hypothetical protein